MIGSFIKGTGLGSGKGIVSGGGSVCGGGSGSCIGSFKSNSIGEDGGSGIDRGVVAVVVDVMVVLVFSNSHTFSLTLSR